MARIVDTVGVEVVPETAGFAGELRRDVSEAMTAATAGQDRTVHIRVTTDADVAERQIRNALAKVQAVTNQIFDRTRAKAQQLYTFLEQRVVIRIANKVREWTQKSIARVKLLMQPFFAFMRERLDQIRRGWQAVSDLAQRGADAVSRKWTQGMAVLSAQLSRVRSAARSAFTGVVDAGRDAFQRVAAAAEPHLARIRAGVERLAYPFRVVRAYGTATFRVLRDEGQARFAQIRAAGEAAMDRVRVAAERIAAPVGRAFRSASTVAGTYLRQIRDDATSAFNTATARAGSFGRATAAVFAAAGRGSDEFAREVRRAGLTVVQTEQGMQASAQALTKAHEGLNEVQATSAKLEKGLEIAEQRLQAAWKASELAITQRARAEDDLQTVQAEYLAQAQKVADIERKLAADRASGTVAASKLQFQEQSLNVERDRGWEVADRLEQAQDKLVKAQEREFDSSAKLLEVEQRGIEVRDRADDAADRLAEAHSRVTQATEDSTRATRLHEAAEQRHLGVLGRVSAQLRNTARSSRVGSVAMNGLARAVTFVQRDVGNLTGLLGGAARTATSAMSSAVEGLSGKIGGPGGLVSAITGLATGFAKIAVIGGAVTYVIGAISAAVVALPGLLLGAAAALGVVVLGFDGVKKAYENGLKPALDKLKTQISDVFEAKLTPAFRKLSTELLPQVTEKLKTLATSVANVGVHLVDLVTKGENVGKINKLIDTMGQIISSQVDPALQKLVQSFIDLGSNAQILNAIGGMFTDLITKTSDWLNEMNRTGEATRAVESLRSVMGHLEDLFFRVATAASKFFSDATPGVNKLVDSSGRLVDMVGEMGGAFGDAAEGAASLIDSIPQSTLDAIVDAVKKLGEKLKEAGQDRGLQQLLQTIGDQLPGIIDGFTQFADAVMTVADGFEQLQYGVAKADEFLGTTNQTERDLIKTHEAAGDAAKGMGDATKEGADKAKDSLGELPPAADEAGKGIEDGVKPPVERIPGVVDSATGQVSFQPVLDAANDVFGQLPTSVADGINKSVDSMTQGTDRIRVSAETGFRAASDAATTSMTSVSQVVEQNMQSAGASAETGGTRIGDGIRAGVQAAADTAQSGMGRVSQSVQAAMDIAAQTAESGGQRIATAITDNVNRASDAAQSGMARLSESVRTGIDQAAQAAQAGMDKVAQAVQQGMDRAADAARAGGDRVADAVRAGTDRAADAARSGMDAVVEAVRAAMDRAASAAQAGGDRIRSAVQAAFTGVTSVVTEAMARTVQVITAGMQRCTQVVTQGMTQIRNVYTQGFQQIVQVITQAWQRIVQAFEQGGQRAVQISVQTGQRILQTFRALSGPMYDAGFQIISRLAAGMVAAQGQAFAAAASTAAGIRARFPASPAKEGPLSGSGDPLRSGGVIVQRLADGMAANAAAATSALDPILARMVSRVAALAPAGPSAPSGSSPVSVARPGSQVVRAQVEQAVRASVQVSDSGSVLAEMKAQTETLLGIYREVAANGYSSDVLDRLDRLVAGSSAEPAAVKTQRQRSTAALGLFG